MRANNREILGCHPCILELNARPSGDRLALSDNTALGIHGFDGPRIHRLDAAEAIALHKNLGLSTLTFVAHCHLILWLPLNNITSPGLVDGYVRDTAWSSQAYIEHNHIRKSKQIKMNLSLIRKRGKKLFASIYDRKKKNS